MSQITNNQTVRAFVAAVTMVPLLLAGFLVFEPTVTTGQETFTIKQEILEEIAFTTAPQNIEMDTQLQGLTGGISNGSTTFAVTTNNATGYTVNINFASTTAMEHDTVLASIPNVGSTVMPILATTTVTGSAFGYSLTGANIANTFTGTTGGCSTGSGTGDADACWYLQADATTEFTIVDSDNPTAGGGEPYDLYFRVVVDQNPVPALPEGTYTATATLTAANKL